MKSLSRRWNRGERECERERERERERGRSRSRSRPFRGRKGGERERERVRAAAAAAVVRWRGMSESSTLSAAPSSCPPFMWDNAVRAEAASAYSR
jgi:hypothetical protein